MYPPILTRRNIRRRLMLAVPAAATVLTLWNCGTSTSPPQGPGVPGAVTVSITDSVVHLTWSSPANAAGVRVLRRVNTLPAGPDDPQAAVLYAGSATQYADDLRALLPNTPGTPRTYHYTVYGCDAAGRCEGNGSQAHVAPTVVQCLRAGGYTVYFRHATAGICTDRLDLGTAAETTVPDWWKSCGRDCGASTASQLSDAGILQATQAGTGLRARGIPVGRVLASEFCRCIETAQYLGFEPEPDPGVTYFVYDEGSRCTACRQRLGTLPLAGTNTIVVGHGDFDPSCPILSGLADCEAAIFKPDGSGGAIFITKVLADDWNTLP